MILIDDEELEAYERVCSAADNLEILMDEDVVAITTSEFSVERVTSDMVEFKKAVDAYRAFKTSVERN